MGNYLNAVQPVGICGNLLELTVNLLSTPTPDTNRPSHVTHNASNALGQYEHTRKTTNEGRGRMWGK
jgi:hypothetical protein